MMVSTKESFKVLMNTFWKILNFIVIKYAKELPLEHSGYSCIMKSLDPWQYTTSLYFFSSAWTTEYTLAFCNSFSISTWLLWRTLQRKFQMTLLIITWVPIMYTHNTWIGFFSYTWKVQESNFYNGLQSTTYGVPISLIVFVLLKSWEHLIILKNVENWMWLKT